MEILHSPVIPFRGLHIGSYVFKFAVGEGFFEGFAHSPVDGGEAEVTVEALRSSSGMTLRVSIDAQARVQCDRCLEPLDLDVECEGVLEVRAGDDRAGDYDGDELWIATAEEGVDLSQYVYESVCLALPLVKVHGEGPDGVSLCDPDMLARLGRVSVSAEPQPEGENSLRKQLEKLNKQDL